MPGLIPKRKQAWLRMAMAVLAVCFIDSTHATTTSTAMATTTTATTVTPTPTPTTASSSSSATSDGHAYITYWLASMALLLAALAARVVVAAMLTCMPSFKIAQNYRRAALKRQQQGWTPPDGYVANVDPGKWKARATQDAVARNTVSRLQWLWADAGRRRIHVARSVLPVVVGICAVQVAQMAIVDTQTPPSGQACIDGYDCFARFQEFATPTCMHDCAADGGGSVHCFRMRGDDVTVTTWLDALGTAAGTACFLLYLNDGFVAFMWEVAADNYKSRKAAGWCAVGLAACASAAVLLCVCFGAALPLYSSAAGLTTCLLLLALPGASGFLVQQTASSMLDAADQLSDLDLFFRNRELGCKPADNPTQHTKL